MRGICECRNQERSRLSTYKNELDGHLYRTDGIEKTKFPWNLLHTADQMDFKNDVI
jgi:hypothetical protein